MQKIILLLFLMIQTFYVNAQIDSLVTEDEVKAFIKTLDRHHKHFELKKITDLSGVYAYGKPLDTELCQIMSEQLGIDEAFEKGDFDGNGLTDILLLGKHQGISALIVLNMGQNKYTYHSLNHYNQNGCIYPRFVDKNHQPLIELTYQKALTYSEYRAQKRNQEEFRKSHPDELITQNLIFRNGDLVEYNPNPINHDIEKIEFSAGACYGSCPIFELTIDDSMKAQFNAIKFNRKYDPEVNEVKEIQGLYLTYLEPEKYYKLIDQINYLDFPNLKDSYAREATDLSSAHITVTYDSGLVKSIHDYGKNGTFGLRNLYITLTKLRFDLPWELQSKPAENSSELN